MRFDLITLFPELLTPLFEHGITRRAYQSGQLRVKLWNPRDYTSDTYRRVDDRPFGGGPGMVMLAEPLALCVQAIQAERGDRAPVVLFAPGGQTLNQVGVERWAHSQGAILICARYEGVDQRFIDRVVSAQISLGDFVLSGGEIAAMAFLDALARLLPGVLGDPQSHQQDSFNEALDGLLDCPHYTRPETWRGDGVPAPLLSGHHAQIERWRRDQRLLLTQQLRPQLIEAARRAARLDAQDEAVLARALTGDRANETVPASAGSKRKNP